MKRMIILLVLSLGLPLAALAAHVALSQNVAAPDVVVTVLESSPTRTVVRFDVNGFSREAVTIGGEEYTLLKCGKEAVRLDAAEPALPRLSRSVIIPDDAEMEIRVIDSSMREFAGVRVAPSKGNLLRTVDPESVPYAFGAAYQNSQWYPADVATLRAPYILRDVRGTVIDLNAFQYNAALQTLRVWVSVTVEITEVGQGMTNVLHRTRPFSKVDPEFQQIYERHFLNWGQNALLYTPVPESGELLIITYDAFHSAVMPFADWKVQKGIKTTVVDASTIGTTSTAIRAYIQSYYNNADHDLGSVLLVGDAEQIPTPSASAGSSDPTYSKCAGNDDYPDIFVGRFSAATEAQVQTQVQRSVEYERDAQAGANWYHLGTCIGSAEGPGHDGGEYDYQHENFIRTDLLNFTYTAVDQIYDPGATAGQVTTALNAGRSIINYTGHGSATSWVTTGFSNGNVAALTNDNMLPFIISVACVNGQFAGFTCFAEAWLRSTHNGEPVGAVATYMSSINQSWNPPMDAQDEVSDLLIAQTKTTMGGLCYNGSCQMMDVNPGSDGADMFNTWHIFGDPTLQVRTATPQAMTVGHDGQIFLGDPTYAVNVAGVPGALCALSAMGIGYGAAYTNAAGSAEITIEGELPIGDPLTLTVTAFNKLTYIGSVDIVTSGPDTHPPSISFVPLPNTNDATGPYILRATIRDYSGVQDAMLHVSFDSLTFISQPMVRDTGRVWYANFGGYPAGTIVYYFISATDSSENHNQATSPVSTFSILGTVFSDDFESGQGQWTNSAILTGWADQWHISTEMSHSAGHAWKFGDTSTGNYANHAYGGLVTPVIHLRGAADLSFWHWMQGESSTYYPDSAYDGGALDISVDNADWQQLAALTPAYNKLSRCTAGGSNPYTGPFTCRTPVFSGDIGWTQESINLDSYAGHDIQLRFRFGSDNAGVREGWYVDDILITGLPPEPSQPAEVTNLALGADATAVYLHWGSTGAPYYRIYSSESAEGPYDVFVGSTTQTVYSVPADAARRFFIVKSSTLP